MKMNRTGKVLSAVVILAVIGIGGWFALGRNEKPQSNSQNTSTPTDTVQQKEGTDKTEIHQLSNDDFTFEYPKGWVSAETDEGVAFKSPDYALKELAGQYERGAAYEVGAGYKLTVQVLAADAPNKTLAELTSYIEQQEKILGGGSHKLITVDDNQGLLVNDKNSTQSLYAIIFKGQKRIHIQLDAKDDSTAETMAVFDKILASFKIK